jgi:histidine decarboxylase
VDGSILEVYDAMPLLTASEKLFGTSEKPRYPLVPGAFTICANKNVAAYRPPRGQVLQEGEAYGVWSIISLSIAQNPAKDADLFIEDVGLWTAGSDESALIRFLDERRRLVAETTLRCGRHSGVVFAYSYIGYAYTIMQPDEMGMAIVVGPYVTLARKGVPPDGFDALRTMSLSQWVALNPL